MQEIMSPFNIVNFIVVLITLAPGIAAHMLMGGVWKLRKDEEVSTKCSFLILIISVQVRMG